MNIMTKRGQLDNIITYQHICDTNADIPNIPSDQITLGSVCIVLQGESGGLQVYMASSQKQWQAITTGINGGSGSGEGSLQLYICDANEYNNQTNIPTVVAPNSSTIYLVPTNNENDLYAEWIYVNDSWERFGNTAINLSNYALLSNIPSNVSELTNDIGYLTQQDISNKADKTGTILNTTLSRGRKANTTIGEGSFAFGIDTTASGAYSHAQGNNTTASGDDSHAQGCGTLAAEKSSHAEGIDTKARGYYSHAEGNNTVASSTCSHAEGADTTASATCSHAEGQNTLANGIASHAEGTSTVASGYYSHAEGGSSRALGSCAHAEGGNTGAIGGCAHSEGSYTTASGACSHVEGNFTIASGNNQHVQGKYNIEDLNNKYADIIGIGTYDNARANGYTLDWDGNGWYAGKVTVGNTTPTENGDLTSKAYVDAAIANKISASDIPVTDVQVNGVSVVSNGVADVSVATDVVDLITAIGHVGADTEEQLNISSLKNDNHFWNSEGTSAVLTSYSGYCCYNALEVSPGEDFSITIFRKSSKKQHAVLVTDNELNILASYGKGTGNTDGIETYEFTVPNGGKKILLTTDSSNTPVVIRTIHGGQHLNSVPDLIERIDRVLTGKTVAIIGDSISTNGTTGTDANVPEITITAEDIGVELSAYLTYNDVQAGLNLGEHTFTSSEIGTEVTFTPVAADVGKSIGMPTNYNPNSTTVWWEVMQKALGNTTIPVCWSGASITSHEASSDSYKTSYAWHDAQIRKCGTRIPGTMTRTAPDIIIIYRGTNDFSHTSYATLTSGYFDNYNWQYPSNDTVTGGYGFKEGLCLTVKKLREAYPAARIFLCTLNIFKRVNYNHFPTNNGINSLPQYNAAIREVADFLGCGLIDFAKDGITFENCYSEGYITDSSTTPTHPSDKGHNIMGKKAIADIQAQYR